MLAYLSMNSLQHKIQLAVTVYTTVFNEWSVKTKKTIIQGRKKQRQWLYCFVYCLALKEARLTVCADTTEHRVVHHVETFHTFL